MRLLRSKPPESTPFDFFLYVHQLSPWPAQISNIAISCLGGTNKRPTILPVRPPPNTANRPNHSLQLGIDFYVPTGLIPDGRGGYQTCWVELTILEGGVTGNVLGKVAVNVSDHASNFGQNQRIFPVATFNQALSAQHDNIKMLISIGCRRGREGPPPTSPPEPFPWNHNNEQQESEEDDYTDDEDSEDRDDGDDGEEEGDEYEEGSLTSDRPAVGQQAPPPMQPAYNAPARRPGPRSEYSDDYGSEYSDSRSRAESGRNGAAAGRGAVLHPLPSYMESISGGPSLPLPGAGPQGMPAGRQPSSVAPPQGMPQGMPGGRQPPAVMPQPMPAGRQPSNVVAGGAVPARAVYNAPPPQPYAPQPYAPQPYAQPQPKPPAPAALPPRPITSQNAVPQQRQAAQAPAPPSRQPPPYGGSGRQPEPGYSGNVAALEDEMARMNPATKEPSFVPPVWPPPPPANGHSDDADAAAEDEDEDSDGEWITPEQAMKLAEEREAREAREGGAAGGGGAPLFPEPVPQPQTLPPPPPPPQPVPQPSFVPPPPPPQPVQQPAAVALRGEEAVRERPAWAERAGQHRAEQGPGPGPQYGAPANVAPRQHAPPPPQSIDAHSTASSSEAADDDEMVLRDLIMTAQDPRSSNDARTRAMLSLRKKLPENGANLRAFVAAGGLEALGEVLTRGQEPLQYTAARILRQVALSNSAFAARRMKRSSQQAHLQQVLPSVVVPLVRAMQGTHPRVASACAAALAMLAEHCPDVCDVVIRNDGLHTLLTMLRAGGPNEPGKKAAAEALHGLAAEAFEMKQRIVDAGAVRPLVQLAAASTASISQKTAAAGALQMMSYYPPDQARMSREVAGHGAIPVLVDLARNPEGSALLSRLAAGALANVALSSPENQTEMVAAGALPVLVQLLRSSQPEGQYAAAAALYNIAAGGRTLRSAIVEAGAVAELKDMLASRSWYCRIVAADLLARLASDTELRSPIIVSGVPQALAELLQLSHSPGMLESVDGPILHLTYERREEYVVMQGYKFARAKIAAAAALGCLALGLEAHPQIALPLSLDEILWLEEPPEIALSLDGVLRALEEMLCSGNREARQLAAAALRDLSIGAPHCKQVLFDEHQGSVRRQLVAIILRAPPVVHRAEVEPDVGAAALALVALAGGAVERHALLLRECPYLLDALAVLFRRGYPDPWDLAADALDDVASRCEEHRELVDRVLQESTAVAMGRLEGTVVSAALLRGNCAAVIGRGMELQESGYAITARPSSSIEIGGGAAADIMNTQQSFAM